MILTSTVLTVRFPERDVWEVIMKVVMKSDNDLHYDDAHDNDDVKNDDEMKLNLLEQKPELQLAPEVDRRATNRWKGQGGSQQPRNIIISYRHQWINIVI